MSDKAGTPGRPKSAPGEIIKADEVDDVVQRDEGYTDSLVARGEVVGLLRRRGAKFSPIDGHAVIEAAPGPCWASATPDFGVVLASNHIWVAVLDAAAAA